MNNSRALPFWMAPNRLLAGDQMMSEFTSISVERFRNPHGEPTCCADHVSRAACRFLGTSECGTVDICKLGDQRGLYRIKHWLRPDEACDVWADEPSSASSVRKLAIKLFEAGEAEKRTQPEEIWGLTRTWRDLPSESMSVWDEIARCALGETSKRIG